MTENISKENCCYYYTELYMSCLSSFALLVRICKASDGCQSKGLMS